MIITINFLYSDNNKHFDVPLDTLDDNMAQVQLFQEATSRDSDVWKGLPSKSKMPFNIFTYYWLLMMTGNIVPLDAVAIKVVEHSHARFGLSTLLNLFSVVRLLLRWLKPSSKRPVMEGSSICW